MSTWDKLLEKLSSLSSGIRFEELKKILEHYGYQMNSPRGGSSHRVFRKEGHNPITIPEHKPIKKIYIEKVREIVESEEKKDEVN